MFGFFKKKASQAAANAATNIRRLENKDLVEAAVGGMVLVAFADGTCSDDELAKLQAVAEASPAFAGFTQDIPGLVERYAQQFKVSYAMGRVAVLREIADISADRAAKEDALVAMAAVALADGKCSDKEKDAIIEVTKKMGMSMSDIERVL